MTEEATNDEEWGPATTVMAAISDACYRADQYPRIMQVLHGRYCHTIASFYVFPVG